MKSSGTRYMEIIGVVIIMMALVRCLFPSIAEPKKAEVFVKQDTDSISSPEIQTENRQENNRLIPLGTKFTDEKGNLIKNRIYSVPSYKETFPDLNDIQIASAKRWGVKPVADREEAERRKAELVYVGSNPYYEVDKLNNSIPYLVPAAAVLLQEIGRNYLDSLMIKGIPLHKLIVTSVTRSKADVKRLRNHNQNASENSCHLYGTTFDICYNRYITVSDPQAAPKRAVSNDTLKWVLSEVLRDLRANNRCYIKYEVKQGCFHITVK